MVFLSHPRATQVARPLPRPHKPKKLQDFLDLLMRKEVGVDNESDQVP